MAGDSSSDDHLLFSVSTGARCNVVAHHAWRDVYCNTHARLLGLVRGFRFLRLEAPGMPLLLHVYFSCFDIGLYLVVALAKHLKIRFFCVRPPSWRPEAALQTGLSRAFI